MYAGSQLLENAPARGRGYALRIVIRTDRARQNGARPFAVLFVCTANRARSPMAQLLIERELDRVGLHWTIHSAGTRALDGEPVHPLTSDVLQEVGIDATAFRSAALSQDLIASADLILTAQAEHRETVVNADVHALGRTFTLLQFARYVSLVSLTSVPAAELGRQLLHGATIARSRFQPVKPLAYDLPDPIRGRIGQFRSCRDTTTDAVASIVRPLVAATSQTSAVVGPSTVTSAADNQHLVAAADASVRARRRLRLQAARQRRS